MLLLWPQPAGGALHLNAGEHRHGGADHIRRDSDALPADQISAALAQAKLHRPTITVHQRASVIAEQAAVTLATGEADFLLDGLFAQAMPYLLANLA